MGYTEKAQQCVDMVDGIRRLVKSFYHQEDMKGENFLLFYLARKGGEAAPSQISHALQVTTPRTTALLNSLEEKGYILRTHSKPDRRRASVTLTQAGREHVERTRGEMVERTADLLEYLGQEDAEELVRILDRLSQYAEAKAAGEAPGRRDHIG